jgi:phosphatidylserine decarboxylase
MFHKEGFSIISITSLFIIGLAIFTRFLNPTVFAIFIPIALVIYVLVLQFFRNPTRKIPVFDDNIVYAPADGKVVVIEETQEDEYFKDKRIQVSIFMSPLNVHVNRNPVSGLIKYYKYHAGKYLVAWHPKSSTENERTTTVIDNGKAEILLRQIAGAVAKRIINYVSVGDQVKQGEDMGFIRFGSRVDIFFPIGTKIDVNINDVVKGNKTVIAKL